MNSNLKQVGIAIVGTGLIGSLYARICQQMYGVKLVALCDVDAVRVEALSKELNTATYAGNAHRQMLEEHPEIDGVIVCTPEGLHVDPALTALGCSKHVLIEKPLATTIQDAKRIVEAASKSPVVSMVSYSLRFDPRYAAMKQTVASGEIGDITHIYARRSPPVAALERIKGRVELPFWVGVHDIDMMRWVVGAEIVRVYATSTRKGLKDRGVQTAYLSNLTFENGVIAILENAWAPFVSPARQLSTAFFKVQGTKGLVEVRNYEAGVTIVLNEQVYSPDTVCMPEVYGRTTGVYCDQIACFIRCIREGTQSPIPLIEGLTGVRVAEAIIKSAELRQEVAIQI